ncbi:MAG: fatty acid hydroxylase superfamily-domain-containing protein [Piptocephalis tieghemiana]|nr:MAG: fatty acid hydroxylase superfamily-domain-containing protein [Piptocephalis tieghemiana]
MNVDFLSSTQGNATTLSYKDPSRYGGYEPNWIESLWLGLFDGGRNPMLVVTAVSFLMHEIVYFGRFLPFYAIDRIPYFRQYKLQGGKEMTPSQFRKCFALIAFSHCLVELPMMFGFHPFAEAIGMRIIDIFPSWYTMVMQVAIFFVFEDFFHYWMHRALHWGPLYRHIHKVHHEFPAPFGLTAEYAHPMEALILGTGTLSGPLLYLLATGDFHIVTMLVWTALRLMQAVDAHSGYDFPWSFRHIFPGWAGAEHHDYHHQAFIGNYSSSFRWWDDIFGTSDAYHRFRDRQQKRAAEAHAKVE